MPIVTTSVMRVKQSTIRFSTFPRTEAPPPFTVQLVDVFREHETQISTRRLSKGLTSDAVLKILTSDLVALGFDVESGKKKADKIERPVFFGEGGAPTVRYEIDAYNSSWRCGLEVEAGRGWMGNAVYRDLIQALVMVDVDYLCIGVSNAYRYNSGGKTLVSKDYENTVSVADALFGHSRIQLPYRLIVIGY
jgi:hypothetical protein